MTYRVFILLLCLAGLGACHAAPSTAIDLAAPAPGVRVTMEKAHRAGAVEHASDGVAQQRYVFEPAVRPQVRMAPASGAWDWSKQGEWHLRVQNAMPWAVTLTVAIDSAKGRTLRTGLGRYLVKVTDASGCEGGRVVNVTSTVSVAWEKPSAAFRIYPHPVHDRLTVEAMLEHEGRVEIEVTDMRGEILLTIDDRASAGAYRREIALAALPAGAYMLQLHADGRHWREKIVVR